MSAQREHIRPDSVLITHISRANVIQACKPTHHRNHTWPSLYAFRLLLRCMSERRPLFWLLQLDRAVVSEHTDTTWVSKTDGYCLVVWIYRFMITGSVARNKLSANYACVCVGEDDKVLGGTVSELNPEKLRACWLTRSQHSTLLFELILSYLSSLHCVCCCFVSLYSLWTPIHLPQDLSLSLIYLEYWHVWRCSFHLTKLTDRDYWIQCLIK